LVDSVVGLLLCLPAEDGIRVFHVTGVQTCALPIYDAIDASRASTIPDGSSVPAMTLMSSAVPRYSTPKHTAAMMPIAPAAARLQLGRAAWRAGGEAWGAGGEGGGERLERGETP